MFRETKAFSGFSVSDLAAAKEFYSGTLGLEVEVSAPGLRLGIGNGIVVYQKDNHAPATYTMLNFPVDDIDQAVTDLKRKGVKFEHYEGLTDEKGVARGIASGQGPDIAWFTDPAGNILSILKEP